MTPKEVISMIKEKGIQFVDFKFYFEVHVAFYCDYDQHIAPGCLPQCILQDPTRCSQLQDIATNRCSEIPHVFVSGFSIFLNSSVVNGCLLFGIFFTLNFILENGLKTVKPCLIPQFAKTFNLVSLLLIFCGV